METNNPFKSGATPRVDVIPPQYAGLPSDVVEELWELPVMIDPTEYAMAMKNREQSLGMLKKWEFQRENKQTEQLTRIYQGLSLEQQKKFSGAQLQAGQRVIEHIQERNTLDVVSREEQHVLAKLQLAYREFKTAHPSDAFTFELSQDIDRKIYANLVQRLAFHELAIMQTRGDQEKIKQVRNEAGLLSQTETPIDRERYLDWPYAKKMNDLARDLYYTLSTTEKEDYKKRGIGVAMALLLYIPFGRRDDWPEKNMSGEQATSKEDCIKAVLKVEAYLKERGLI